MKKVIIITMMSVVLLSGCTKEEPKKTENSYIKSIEVVPITVRPIEIK